MDSGVVTGDDLPKIFELAKENQFALPAVNVVGTNSINAVLESAKNVILLLLFNLVMVEHHFMLEKD